MRTLFKVTFALSIPMLLSSCLTPRYLDRVDNPIEGVRKVAIAPLYTTRELTNLSELDLLLTREVTQFPGVDRVIPPLEVSPVIIERQLDLRSELDLRHLATLLRVDAILIVEITQYEWITKPAVAFLSRLYISDSPLDRGTAALDMSRGGKIPNAGNPGPGSIVEIERVYDSAENQTRDQIWWYSFSRNGEGQALTGVERILKVPNEYFQFASFSLINAVFGEYMRRLEEVQRENT